VSAAEQATGDPGQLRSYHGQPVLKEPIWSWEIPCYFFAGGMAGASAGLAFLSELRGNEVLARRAWAVAASGVVISPPLLISDLGRPLRFLNMLRMFKVTSPMSVGSWIITGAGPMIAMAALNAWTDLFPRAASIARPAAATLGLPLSTYTAALISNTAVPAWHEARRELPFVFGSGAALGAGAAATMLTPPAHAGPARRLAVGAALSEGVMRELMQQRLGELAEPYKRPPSSRLARFARVSIASGVTLLLRRGSHSRAAAIASGALMCAGALAARWSVFKAGSRSASDPKYVVGPQRAAIERGDRQGASRRQAEVEVADPAKGSPATAEAPAAAQAVER
jgi:hypothetical protein